MASTYEVMAKVSANTASFEAGMDRAERSASNTGSKIAGAMKVGAFAVVAAGVAIAGFAKTVLESAEAAAVEDARLQQIATSMGLFGEQTDAVVDRIANLADAQARLTGVDDGVIKNAQAKLLTFKEIAVTADEMGGTFDRATKAALDLGAAGFGTAESNAVQLGKALNDPVKGVSALSRAGVTFTQVEKDKIQTLVESNNMLEAQNMVLSAIETQVGGTAEATATASDKMKVAFNQSLEQLEPIFKGTFDSISEVISNSFVPMMTTVAPIFETLIKAILPIVEKALPVFMNLLSALTPIAVTLISAMEPLLDALSPLMDAFILIVEAAEPLIAQIMPIFIQLVEMLAPIIAELAVALIPIVEALLPPLLELFEAMIPIIQMIADIFTTFVLPVLMKLVEMALPPLIALIETLTMGFEWLESILGPVYDAIKPVLDGILAIAGIPNSALQKEVVINTTYRGADATERSIQNKTPFLPISADQAERMLQNSGIQEKFVGFAEETGEAMGNAIGSSVGSATASALDKATQDAERAAAEAQRAAQEAARRAAEELERARQKTLDALESFSESVKSVFGGIKENILGAFNLPSLGSSVNSITRNIKKLIASTRSFATNIRKLSQLGLQDTLLQQVIQAGPQAGGRLAEALVTGGGRFIGELNASFAELGSLGSDIANIGTTSAFGNQEVINNYNIEVTGGVGSGPTIGKAIVDAIKSYERTSGAVWQGA